MIAALNNRNAAYSHKHRGANAHIRWKPDFRWRLVGMTTLILASFVALCLKLTLWQAR